MTTPELETQTPAPGSDWREKYRVRIGFFFGLLFLWRAQPRNIVFLLVGLGVALVGVLFRQWAAGCVRKNDEVTSSGPYAWVRHPLYLGSFVMAAGLIFASSSVATALSKPFLDRTLLFWAFLWILIDSIYMPKILREEEQLRAKFPGRYEQYMAEVPRMIPKRITFDFSTFSWDQWKKNKEYGSLAGYAVLALVLMFRFLYKA